MITHCPICSSELKREEVPITYIPEGWEKMLIKAPPTSFDHWVCHECLNGDDDYFSASYIGDFLWCICLQLYPKFYIFNNYLADNCKVNTYNERFELNEDNIDIAAALKIDINNLSGITELIKAYVVFT